MSPFRFRRSWRLLPFRFTLSERGWSWGLRVGPWSWSPRTRRHTVNTPGLGYWQSGRRRRAR